MAIKAIGLEAISKRIEEAKQEAEERVIRLLSYLGKKCVAMVRDRSGQESWYDRTGALRNSIGYCVVASGQVVKLSGFAKGEGAEEGQGLAERIAQTMTAKYALIVVAGMHYAVYVEAMEHKDVLASSELYARTHLPKLIKRLQEQLIKKI